MDEATLGIPYSLIQALPQRWGMSFVKLAMAMDKLSNNLELSYKQLAEIFGTSRKTAIAHIRAMEKAGFVVVKRLHYPGVKNSEINKYSFSGEAKNVIFWGKNYTTLVKKLHPLSIEEDIDDSISLESISDGGKPDAVGDDFNNDDDDKLFDAPADDDETQPDVSPYPAIVVSTIGHERAHVWIQQYGLETVQQWCEYVDKRGDRIKSPPDYIYKMLLKGDPVPSLRGKRKTQQADDDYFGGRYGHLLEGYGGYGESDDTAGDPDYTPPPPAKPAPVEQPAAWLDAYAHLESTMDAGSFATWVSGAQFIRMDGDVYVIGVKNEYARDMLTYRMKALVTDALGGADVTFEIKRERSTDWHEEIPLHRMLRQQKIAS